MQILIIIALVLIAAAVVFAVQNVAAVAVTLFFWKVPSSLALVLLIALVAGVLIGLLLVLPGSIKNRMAVSNQKKKLAALEDERDTYKAKSEASEKEVTKLEEQLSSFSAALEEKQTGEKPSDQGVPKS